MIPAATSYDLVPYPDGAGATNHTRRVQAVAAWAGFNPPDIASARVLELGCGAATNLLCQAIEFPQSEYLGLDYSRLAIDQGLRDVESLQLKNIRLHCADLADDAAAPGTFDYILCHGVFSWVDSRLQHKILEIISSQLRDDGFAYVSFNALPGWHLRQVIRDMLLFHTKGMAPHMAIEQSREVLAQAAQISSPDSPYGKLIRQEYCLLCTAGDGYLYHEMLETHNQPFRFVEFHALLEEHELEYVGEADFAKLLLADVPAEIRARLEPLAVEDREQYLDYWRGTSFRASIVRRKTGPAKHGKPHSLTKFHFGLSREVVIARQADNPLEEEIIHKDDTHPAIHAVAECLEAHRPEYVSWSKLLELAQGNEHQLREYLYQTVASGALEPVITPSNIHHQLGHLPHANPLARLQAQRGQAVMTQRMQMFELSDFERMLLNEMDGKQSLETIRHHANEWIKQDLSLLNLFERHTTTEQTIEDALQRLGRIGLVTG